MGKFSKSILDNIQLKEMNSGLLAEIKRQRETIAKKDKFIADLMGGTLWTKNLIETVNEQEKVIKSGKKKMKLFMIAFIVMFILVLIK